MKEIYNLKGCPMCGKLPSLSVRCLGDHCGYADRVTVECECGLRISRDGDYRKGGYADNSTVHDEAATAWNRRIEDIS